jgi:hypothetical protein
MDYATEEPTCTCSHRISEHEVKQLVGKQVAKASTSKELAATSNRAPRPTELDYANKLRSPGA